MRASVCIATYNRYASLEHTLDSVLSADLSSVIEILVIDQSVDTDSMQDSLRRLLAHRMITYRHEDIPSLTRARNIGLRMASSEADIIIYIDDDVSLCRDFFNQHIDAYRDEGVYAVGGREIVSPLDQKVSDGGQPVSVETVGSGKIPGVKRVVNRLLRAPVSLSWKRNRYGKNRVSPGLVIGAWLFVGMPGEAQSECRMDTVRGCNMSFRREALQRIGGFDERFAGSARREESDVCFTLMRHMGRDSILYRPEAVLVHHMHAAGGCRSAKRLRTDHVTNELLFVSKHIANPIGRYLVKGFIRCKLLLRERDG